MTRLIITGVVLAASTTQGEPPRAKPPNTQTRTSERQIVYGRAGMVVMPDLDSPEAKAKAEVRREQRLIERELRRIRYQYFRATNNTEIRQVGLAKMREYTDPIAFEPLLEVFGESDAEVREAMLDHIAAQATPESDAALTWAAVYADNEQLRNAAAYRVHSRFDQSGEVTLGQERIIASGLAEQSDGPLTAAANLADMLKLYQAIPMLINAQIGGGPSGGTERAGALGQIWVAQQQAFVSDLQPVVSDSAVGFDPTLDVVSSGVVMRVMDASVVIYRSEVHQSLISLSSNAWGKSTADLGWDRQKWHDWYTGELLPHLAEKARTDAELEPDAGP